MNNDTTVNTDSESTDEGGGEQGNNIHETRNTNEQNNSDIPNTEQ